MDKKESSKKPLSLDLQFSVIRFAIFGDSLYSVTLYIGDSLYPAYVMVYEKEKA